MTRIHTMSLAAALFVTTGNYSCKGHEHGHSHDDAPHAEAEAKAEHGGHGHEHAEDAIGITRFTDTVELFAEHPPAVTGQPLPFLAHLTILKDFSALQEATVTLVLSGPTTTQAEVKEMLRPGIFQPTLVAPAPGRYQARLEVRGPKVKDTIRGFEIVVHDSADAAKRAAGEQAGGPEPISFLKEQQWQIPFSTTFATQGEVVPTLEVAGEVSTPPSGQAEVGAAIAGRIVAPRGGLARPGQVVKRGELLATIAPAPAAPEAAARADLAVVETQARVQAAQAALQRAERLLVDRAISQRRVDDARRELTVAQQAVQAARRARDIFSGAASGRGGGTYRISAPINGVIVGVEATEGKAVPSGALLFRIVNLQELWILARIPEQQAALIEVAQDAAFKLPGLETWLPLTLKGEGANASVVNVGRTVERRSRTVEVIYALTEPDPRLRVGAMLQVAVPCGEPWRGVIVPRQALIDDDGRSVVYVQLEGEAFEARTVRIGAESGESIGLVSGVQAGERVVTMGANVIRLASRSASTPSHGHVH